MDPLIRWEEWQDGPSGGRVCPYSSSDSERRDEKMACRGAKRKARPRNSFEFAVGRLDAEEMRVLDGLATGAA